jgi:signal transduction histidine kinase/ActR/RegA family two-component response regulator
MSMMLATSGAVLLLTFAGFFSYEYLTFRKNMVRELATSASIIADNSTAVLAFQDHAGAAEILAALKADPHVAQAGLYDRNGAVFCIYPDGVPASGLPPSPGPDGYRFEPAYLVGFQPVAQGGKRLGTLYVKSDLKAMGVRNRLYGAVALTVAALAFVAAYLLSRVFQGQVSGPILALTETARSVSTRRDYSVRAQRLGTGEVVELTDAFNHMLTQIHEQLARMDLLNRITRAIGERQDLPSIFQVMVGTLEDNMPMDFACVCLYDAGSAKLTVSNVGGKAALAAEMGINADTSIPIDQNGLSRCVMGNLVYEPDTSKVDFPFPRRLAAKGLSAMVLSPLAVESNVFGVLIAARREPGSFSSMDCEFLRQLSGHAALAAHQAGLYGALQRAYDDLRQSQQTVMQQERLRALGQMASGIAHDINNAISPVALYTESLLEREPGLSPRARESLETISRAIEDVSATVARMREFYRQNEPQMTLSPVHLNRCMQQVIDLTRARWNDMALQRGIVIKIETDLDPKLPVIMGVEGEIREALTNLFLNAFDAMPEGGKVFLRTRIADGQVRAEVTDTGIGMSEETRRRCLEPFYTTKGERGTGLGLAMVYGVVQRHSAAVEIDSAPGRGTTVRLLFPIPTGIVDTLPPEVAAVSTRRLRLLIIDDDPIVLKSLNDALGSEGHAVTPANGGQVGLEALAEAMRAGKPFDVVITDLGMPYMDGRKVAEKVKAMSPVTPVILLTGWGQRLLTEGDVPANVDRLLSKPPKLGDLRKALAACVPAVA